MLGRHTTPLAPHQGRASGDAAGRGARGGALSPGATAGCSSWCPGTATRWSAPPIPTTPGIWTASSPSRRTPRYLLREVRSAYPDAPWSPIHFTWAGVRSLMQIEGVPESDVTRKHMLYDHDQGRRARAAQRDRRQAHRLSLGRRGCRWMPAADCSASQAKSSTADLPLPGGMIGGDFDTLRAGPQRGPGPPPGHRAASWWST